MCAACRARLDRPLAGPVCGECWRSIVRISAPWCQRCGDALPSSESVIQVCARCTDDPPLFDVARSAATYEGPVRKLIHALKYEGRRIVAAPLARMMAAAGADLLEGADAVVPVPLHPWRTLSRGFNQADELARCLGVPVWRVLRRTRHGPPQATLPAGRRGPNVRGAFASRRLLFAEGRHTRAGMLRGRVVVVIDDVMTTGATLDACSRALLDAGVESVRALTVARAVAARPWPRPLPPLPSTAPRR
jgi:ComF family protein